MDIPLALNYIGIHKGLAEHKSSLRSAIRRANVNFFVIFMVSMVTLNIQMA